MPTRGRNALAATALDSFMSQRYANRHLLILDDAQDPSFRDNVDVLSHVSYLRHAHPLNIPQKRNLLCQYASGDIIVHFDSDDWSHPDRIDDQVERLQQSKRSVTGYSSMVFKDEATRDFFIYVGNAHYALGTSLCYRRAWWNAHRFAEMQTTGEDNHFIFLAVNEGEFVSSEAGAHMLARLHTENTNPRNMRVFNNIDPPAWALNV
jgi:glycosyltransferase involved in cell wall biosynthesis